YHCTVCCGDGSLWKVTFNNASCNKVKNSVSTPYDKTMEVGQSGCSATGVSHRLWHAADHTSPPDLGPASVSTQEPAPAPAQSLQTTPALTHVPAPTQQQSQSLVPVSRTAIEPVPAPTQASTPLLEPTQGLTLGTAPTLESVLDCAVATAVLSASAPVPALGSLTATTLDSTSGAVSVAPIGSVPAPAPSCGSANGRVGWTGGKGATR
ncbi:unnamed protein product, partial [Choristocarpus tenellus]